MKKTIQVTITLTYNKVEPSHVTALLVAVGNEAESWVDSGSFGEDMYTDEECGQLINSDVKVIEVATNEK